MTIPQEEMHDDIKHEEQEAVDPDTYYDAAAAAAASTAPPTTIALNQATETMLITPLNIHNLPANILQHLQQQNLGNVITAFATASDEKIPTPLIPSNTASSSSLLDATDKSTSKNLTADERRQRRLWRNRVAAKECRKKKKQYVHELEETITRLEGENSALRKQVEDIRIKVAKKEQEQQPSPLDNLKLMKQVEELNAKLGHI
ncbi:Skn-1-like basic-leucine zipper transcription factor [Mucor lusitanicus]|uniref:Skn-1-like basic-leucine zipper transcription factor n=2 Tax=Mucor circinelloides f. lusitanicus TaxID=29924 RepID=A0A162QEI1_MUCCL|nr:Skn-1-like basic-leucine zipper transcription factor [Mucor lusitanicus]OAD01360.1 Skn-1-like basic-leucine zipper transcription factor [Mucor lusitanicus CBS 277.49]